MTQIIISIIGKAGHTTRLIGIINKHNSTQLKNIYYPKKITASNPHLTNCFDDIIESDAIIITSPTPTHFDYLKKLTTMNYSGYILVEKPAISTQEQAHSLLQFPPKFLKKLKINYNYRFSDVYKRIEKLSNSKELGKPLCLSIQVSHGLAFRPPYQLSWRSDLNKSFGALETVGVHFINMCIFIFGSITKININLTSGNENISKSTAPDTANLTLTMASGINVNMFISYAAPLQEHIKMIGTNGLWEFDGTSEKLFFPRETLDSNGFFIAPPLQEQKTLNNNYDQSLEKSLQNFFDTIRTRETFNIVDLKRDIESMLPIFHSRTTLQHTR